ncbi:MAG: hypothetical protein WBG10_03155 [Pseudolabrys sp.]
MSSDSDLREERDGVLKWLFDATFGRLSATEDAIGNAIFRLGTLNTRLDEEDD